MLTWLANARTFVLPIINGPAPPFMLAIPVKHPPAGHPFPTVSAPFSVKPIFEVNVNASLVLFGVVIWLLIGAENTAC